MWIVRLSNELDMIIATAYVVAEEITSEDIADLGWILSNGDKITIEKSEEY